MAIVYSTRYRPITTVETGNGDALSSRHALHLSENVNHLKAYDTCPLLIPGQFWRTEYVSQTGTTDERYFAKWPMLPFPSGFRVLRFVLGARRAAGAGTISVKLYTDIMIYNGALSAPDLASEFTPSAVSGSVSFGGGFEYIEGTIGTTSIPVIPTVSAISGEPRVSITMTTKASDTTTTLGARTLMVWCDPDTLVT